MSRRILPALLLVAVVLGSGCIVRKFRISRRGAPPTAQLATASLEDLLGRVSALDQQVQTISATVDLEPALGSVNKGEFAEYKDIRAYVLIRKPGMFRLVGLTPVVRSTLFDMVTDGANFKILFPSKNKVVVGANGIDKPSTNRFENIRPQHLFDALVVRAVGQDERAVLENHTDETEASYIVHVLQGRGNDLKLHRNLWFERGGLQLTRLVIFDNQGDIVTDARYENYKAEKGIPFPRLVTITRPKDEYGIRLAVDKLELNKEMRDDKFTLTVPAGFETIDMQKRPVGTK